ncbi:hypothetical protein ANOBCDAF_01508 [Pleomorphomonas sp. T1.2MG-36]|nr:hypothetical protein ANOBCDAF_01508 [Pleomorphomonas sp. T1.2MG-36]
MSIQAPGRNAVAIRIGTAQDHGPQDRLLAFVQKRLRTRALAIAKAGDPFSVEADHPVAQCLPVHPSRSRRLGTAHAVKGVGDCQKPSCNPAIPFKSRPPTQRLHADIRPNDQFARHHQSSPNEEGIRDKLICIDRESASDETGMRGVYHQSMGSNTPRAGAGKARVWHGTAPPFEPESVSDQRLGGIRVVTADAPTQQTQTARCRTSAALRNSPKNEHQLYKMATTSGASVFDLSYRLMILTNFSPFSTLTAVSTVS